MESKLGQDRIVASCETQSLYVRHCEAPLNRRPDPALKAFERANIKQAHSIIQKSEVFVENGENDETSG